MVEMRKLLPRPQPESFRLPIPSPRGTLPLHRATLELKTPQQHRPGKEPVAEAKKVVTPTSVVPIKIKVVEKEPKTPKTKSSDPFPRRVSIKKVKKEPTPESNTETKEEGSSEDVEEVEVEDSSKEPESKEEEEAKPETPPLKKTRMKTQTSE